MLSLKILKKIYSVIILVYAFITMEKIKNTLLEFKNDNRGALILNPELKKSDKEFLKYCHLSVNWDIPSITKDDLPPDFCNMAVKLVDLFRKKTFDLDYECLMYFDYTTGELIYCFIGDENQINNFVDDVHFKDKNIASIHNHPKGYLSAPSGENFQILDLKFEDYELISGSDGLWIIEAKGEIKNSDDIKEEILYFYDDYLDDDISIKYYEDFLINYLNNNKNNISITKKEFD